MPKNSLSTVPVGFSPCGPLAALKVQVTRKVGKCGFTHGAAHAVARGRLPLGGSHPAGQRGGKGREDEQTPFHRASLSGGYGQILYAWPTTASPPGQGLLHVLLRHRPRSSGIGCLAMPEITLAPLTDRGRELLDALEAAARGVLPFRTSDDGRRSYAADPNHLAAVLEPARAGLARAHGRASGRASTRPDRCVAESRTTIRCLRRRRRTARARPRVDLARWQLVERIAAVPHRGLRALGSRSRWRR